MTHVLESDLLAVTVLAKGAEISSVKDKSGLEFIWQADKTVWPRHAPVLFPIVGKLKDNSFHFNGKAYELGQHGFARDLDFVVIAQEKDQLVFELRSNEKTKTQFPFDFILQIGHRLTKNTLTTFYKVINSGEEPAFFSIGAHPGFRCPLLPREKFEDYYLEFESSHYELTTLANGLRKTQTTPLDLKDRRLHLSTTLFDRDALVFENKQINAISLCSDTSPHRIHMACTNWPYFGIWSKQGNCEFICLEPWYGIADLENSDQNLLQKDGIIRLEPKKEFECSFSVSFV